MAGNKSKSDRLHRQLPKLFQTTVNPNWKALIEALGESDQHLADLIEDVRKQMFVKTSSRPYIDRLAANVNVSRPRFVGMDDGGFRQFIPVLSYQPKQVKLILDSLLDLFFFKEATTAFTQTEAFEPFNLEDGFGLKWKVDSFTDEQIEFKSQDFVTISAATAEEIVAAINRQTEHSFAIVFDDSITKRKYIKLFTNTVGSKGSIEITGGRANIGLRFEGFISNAGTGVNTEWTVTKVGDLIKFQYTAGNTPGINQLQAGDVILSDIPNNKGSFIIERVDISNDAIYFRNLFGTVGIFTQTSALDVKFQRPFKALVYTNDRRAIVWETQSGKITVEMPNSPPVVKRSLRGSAHVNGEVNLVTNRVADDQLELTNAEDWPDSGIFILQELKEIQSRILTPFEDVTEAYQYNSRICGFDIKYTYTGKTGNILEGITPALPTVGTINQVSIISANRDNNTTVTATTSIDHGLTVGETVIVSETINTIDGDPTINLDNSVNGSFKVIEIVNTTVFKYISAGDEGESTGGNARVERISTANSGSLAILKSSQINTKILGPYIWDQNAPFVLSSLTATVETTVIRGSTSRNIDIGLNEIPELKNKDKNQVIFDYGTETQEGPVRVFFKSSDNSLFIDPSYVFKFDHGPSENSIVTLLRQQGPHTMSGNGAEYPAYITDPSVAREVLQDLMQEVKSVGIFMEFLIRFPEQLYATIDVNKTGIDPN